MKDMIKQCPYCEGKELIEAVQGGYATIYGVEHKSGFGVPLYHLVCRDCGSVVRSYVNDPEKLLKRKNRR